MSSIYNVIRLVFFVVIINRNENFGPYCNNYCENNIYINIKFHKL